MIFKLGVVVGTLNGHLGYDIPGWYGPKHHYHHHHLKNVNFGGWPFGFWDRVLGMLSLFFVLVSIKSHTQIFYTGTAHEETELDLKPLLSLLYVPVMFGLIRIAIHLSTALYILLGILFILYLLVVDGAIYLKPRSSNTSKEKVFVIGLSRTGTYLCSSVGVRVFVVHFECTFERWCSSVTYS